MLLAMGLPSEKVDVEERGGCFKKKITRTTTYTEANEKAVYRKAGIANVGDVYNEQTSFDDEELD